MAVPSRAPQLAPVPHLLFQHAYWDLGLNVGRRRWSARHHRHRLVLHSHGCRRSPKGPQCGFSCGNQCLSWVVTYRLGSGAGNGESVSAIKWREPSTSYCRRFDVSHGKTLRPLWSGITENWAILRAMWVTIRRLGELKVIRQNATMTRREHHSHALPGGRGYWWTDRLWTASAGLPTQTIQIDSIAEFDKNCWFNGNGPTCREVAEHARRISTVDLSYPIILAADGSLMDGGHRIAKAYLLGKSTIEVRQFHTDPEPDWVISGEAS